MFTVAASQCQRGADPRGVADVHRLVQAEIDADLPRVLFAQVLGHQDGRPARGQVHDQEHAEADDQQRAERVDEPPEEIPSHVSTYRWSVFAGVSWNTRPAINGTPASFSKYPV